MWLSNIETRRAKLSTEQLQRLADLGLDWAAQALGSA
ncbi:helicase [Streptomyces sp. NPDC007251]